jgi:hypothetical protein
MPAHPLRPIRSIELQQVLWRQVGEDPTAPHRASEGHRRHEAHHEAGNDPATAAAVDLETHRPGHATPPTDGRGRCAAAGPQPRRGDYASQHDAILVDLSLQQVQQVNSPARLKQKRLLMLGQFELSERRTPQRLTPGLEPFRGSSQLSMVVVIRGMRGCRMRRAGSGVGNDQNL